MGECESWHCVSELTSVSEKQKLTCMRSTRLNIRHLKSYFDETLDMNDKVGDLFDDRKIGPNGQVNETSIVKVFRYPPDPRDIRNPQRFASLMPESTARPLKRVLSTFAQNPRVEYGHIGVYEGWRQPDEAFGTASKRQRVHDGPYNPDQPIISREEREGGVYYSSQPSGTQESRGQVYNSQRSPAKKCTSIQMHCERG